MEYLIGVILAMFTAVLGVTVGFDRDRAFYPVVLIVVASYYELFAVMGASRQVLLTEIVAATLFLAIAVWGFKKAPWLVAAGLVGHGAFDSVHHFFITNPGVPPWWPGFCLAYDVALGSWLLLRMKSGAQAAMPPAR